MAEEPKDGLPEGGTPAEPTPAEPTPTEGGTPEPKEVDWEKRYKDLQTDHTQTKQRLADVETQISKPPEQPPEEPPEDYGDEEAFVDRKTVGKMIKDAVKSAVSEVRMQTADSYFRRTYPNIVKHENIISGILRNPKNAAVLKGASAEERIDAAVKEFNKLTEEAITNAKAETEAEAKEREEKNRKATGLGGPSTTPAKSDDEGLSDADELKQRKAGLAKKRGLA